MSDDFKGGERRKNAKEGERRKNVRVYKNFYLHFFEKNRPEQKSDVSLIKDISKGGLYFISSIPLQENAELFLEITIPYIAPKKLVLEAVVVAAKGILGNTKLYGVRVKFISLNFEAYQVLDMVEKRNSKGA